MGNEWGKELKNHSPTSKPEVLRNFSFPILTFWLRKHYYHDLGKSRRWSRKKQGKRKLSLLSIDVAFQRFSFACRILECLLIVWSRSFKCPEDNDSWFWFCSSQDFFGLWYVALYRFSVENRFRRCKWVKYSFPKKLVPLIHN